MSVEVTSLGRRYLRENQVFPADQGGTGADLSPRRDLQSLS